MTAKTNQLAICGGTPTIPAGPPTWPAPDPEIKAALAEAYESGNWGRYHGPYADRLQQRLAEFHQLEHVKLCSSGTIAVELALRGLNLPSDSEVILGAYDFPGNFRCIEQIGARPVLADVDSQHGCLNLDRIVEAYQTSVKAVVVSHLHSGLAPMKAIMEWSREHEVPVVEDACQAPGAIVDGRLAGTWGDIGVLSFGGSKLVTAGRGGAIITNDPVYMQRIRVFADRGNDAFPLSELQAAVILPQLERLAQRNVMRQSSVSVLQERIADIECLTYMGNSSAQYCPSFYKVAWRYNSLQGRWSRAEFIAALRAEGVAADEGFRGFTRRSTGRCRHANDLRESKLTANSTVLLHHPVLLESATSIEAVATAIHKVANGFASSDG